MTVSFQDLPEDARIWVYQAERQLNEEEKAAIRQELHQFTEKWAAHNQALRCAADIVHDRFILLGVDENQHGASGCSIDSSVHFLKNIEKSYKINLFDRSQIAFLKDDAIITKPLSQLPDAIKSGEVGEDTLTFNNTVSSMKDLRENWLQPAEQSWMKRYFS